MRLVFVVAILVLSVQAFASTPISSPWMADDTWQASGGCGGSYYGENYHIGTSAYAIDFNRYPTCASDVGYPIVASADGRVIFADWNTHGFGNVVEIDHGNGLTTFYAHFLDGADIPVKVNEFVKQGQVIGYCGMSGGTSTGEHLHYEERDNGASEQISSMDGYDFCDDQQCRGHVLTSLNRNIFEVEETVQGGLHGTEVGSVHWWPGNWDANDRYGTGNVARRCYIQDYHNSSWGDFAIVYDGLGGARKSYTMRTGFWSNGQSNGWSQQNGPQGSYGMPITNEYTTAAGSRQEFQKGYVVYENGLVTWSGYPSSGPGWTSSGWNNQYSYLFAMAYERNGAKTNVGDALEDVRPHPHQLNPGYLYQRFDGGANGEGAIFYDPDNASGNELATNESYYVYGSFWALWNQKTQEGIVSCPTRDWYMSPDPENWNPNVLYKLQNFIVRNGSTVEQHYMIEKGGIASWHSSYTTQFVSQSPAGQFNMVQGESKTLTVSFRNTGNTTWFNDSVNHLGAYVELKSCDSGGLYTASFLNNPYDSGLGWLNYESPCTMQETSVGPGEVATFTFTGKVASNAPTGLKLVYFRPNHSIGGAMDDWGGMHFQVNVVPPSVYSCQYVSQSPAGQFNFSEGTTKTVEVKFKNTGNTTWRKDKVAYPADYIELRSCNSSGTVTTSFFNNPYDGTISWINGTTPCTLVESSVAPGGTGTFRFTAKVNEGQAPGLNLVYFRPQHATGGLLQDWAGMHFQANVPASYSCAYVSQTPTGTISMSPGQTKSFTVKFKNTGNTTWRKNAQTYPNDYVELKSCDAAGLKTASFLNWPYDASLGWLNYESPTSFNESSVAPGGTATFAFTGKVASGTSPGTRYVYFRPHHSVNGGTLLPGWGNMNFPISVGSSMVYTLDDVPKNFALLQNHPNPFNPVTTIGYSLPKTAIVQLIVYDVNGNEVVTLVDKSQEAGRYKVEWDAHSVGSGVYFYRLRAGSFTETKKMVLLK